MVVVLIVDVDFAVIAACPADREVTQGCHLLEDDGRIPLELQQGQETADDEHGGVAVGDQ